MKIQFLGGARTVTGSCYLLHTGTYRILVDCGMFQGNKELEALNREPFVFNPEDIDAVLLTHAHIDHSGLLPLLHKRGYKGPVICTDTTKELCTIMLPDSGHIQEMESDWHSRKRRRKGRSAVVPLYTEEDARCCLSLFKGVPYHEWIDVVPGVRAYMRDAGHILGSAIIELWVEDEEETIKLVFSGDLGNKEQVIVRDPESVEEADYVFTESTYGDRLHDTHIDRRAKLGEIIRTIQSSGGNIIIPSFSVGRTQEIIYEIAELLHKGEIEPLPVFIDSPLAVEATRVFQNNEQIFDEESQRYRTMGIDPLSFTGLQFVGSVEESQRLNRITSGSIIISSSGMCEAGRIKHHLKHHLWRTKSHIVFVGYQAPGTLGRKIADGAKRVRIFGEDIKICAQIHYIEGFSAHADRKGILDWLSGFHRKPRKVFVVHGEEEVSERFAVEIESRLGLDTYVPARLEVVDTHKAAAARAVVSGPEEETGDFTSMLAELGHTIDTLTNTLKSRGMSPAEKRALAKELDRYVEILEEIAEEYEA